MTSTIARLDPFDRWRRSLAGETVEINPPPDANCGFYRTRMGRDGPLVPVAILPNDFGDGPLVWRNGQIVELDRVWPHCAKSPISEQTYNAVVNGGIWPDLDNVVAEQTAARGIGDNQPPTDPAEILKGEIDAAKAGVTDYAKIEDEVIDAKALSLKNRLTELAGQAVKAHKKAKEPHLEAGRAVDKKWFPLRDAASEAAAAITKAREAWANEKLRRTRQAQADAEAAQRKLDEEARKAAPAGAPVQPAPRVEMPVFAPQTTKAAYGRTSSTKLALKAAIANQDAVYQHFRDDDEIKARLAKLAQKAVDNGLTVPGVTTNEIAKVT